MGFRNYAGVVLLTAIFLQFLPNFSPKLPVNIGGHVEPGFERAAEIFKEQAEKRPDKGIAFTAYYKGRPVVDLWGGYADRDSEQPWNEDTMSVFFSATKGVVAICVAMMVDRGLLDYDKPVAQYWPEFAQNGKENITVRQLVSHQAGLIFINTPVNITILRNHGELGKVLEKERPMWEPGTAFGYHPVTYGMYVSQLMSRVDPMGRTVGQFVRDELRMLYGIDFFIGLPLSENHRVARHYKLPLVELLLTTVADLNWKYALYGLRNTLFPSKLMLHLIKNPWDYALLQNPSDFWQLHRWNNPEYRAVEHPSGNGIGTARGIAKLYGILANEGKDGDRQLLTPERIDQLNTVVVSHCGTGRSFNEPPVWSLGTVVIPNPDGQNMFGHPGYGGQNAMADPYYKIGFGYVSNMNSMYDFGDDPIYVALTDAVYDAVRKTK